MKNANEEDEKELQREISYKLEMALEEADGLIEMLESNVIAICEFILTKIEDEDGMHVFTLFNKTNQKYMDPLEIEPVSKFIKYGENGLLS
ncbi:MAG: hypothetical protein ABIM62_06735 [candidate division WOR-3 bacterium]